MYEEMVFTREALNSAMDALDRLGKQYYIEKFNNNAESEEDSDQLFLPRKKAPHLYDRWIIKEV
ncbi:hypothetical protein M2277_005394 [Paenibacillus sp. LBL]|uniref:hypothetical protein n=1 Tax=Paenibacillus sp. LBL TaxID=2940563 RepID=UPI002475D269|nr:hypothetical protein [Paenibacillus sp. LBL]MDH6674697.1 hypothetical protein [Paenibacillus sp. LBL]